MIELNTDLTVLLSRKLSPQSLGKDGGRAGELHDFFCTNKSKTREIIITIEKPMINHSSQSSTVALNSASVMIQLSFSTDKLQYF